MDKTISITLNGQIYTLTEDAYHKLEEYLSKIKDQLSQGADKDEIIKDIEASISEKFSGKTGAKKQVINIEDVEEIVSILGEAEDIAEIDEENIPGTDNSNEDAKDEEANAKRLYRDPEDVIIAGVCSGIGKYFNVDPVFIRLLFVVSIFFGGAGIFIYIILWIIVPEAKTNLQKLEMQGSKITLKKIEEATKEKSAEIKKRAQDEGWIKILKAPLNFLAEILKAIISFFKKILPVIASIIGFFIILAIAVAVIALSIFTSLLAISKGSGLIHSDIPLDMIIGSTSYYLFVVSTYLLVVIPLLFILLIGIAMIRKKNVFSLSSSTIMIALWIISIILVSTIAIDASPRIEKVVNEWQNEEKQEMVIDLKDFDRLYIADGHKVEISEGNEYKIIASGRQIGLDKLVAEVDRGQLQLTTEDTRGICLPCLNKNIEFKIISPELTEIKTRGASEVFSYGFSPDTMRIHTSGISKADVFTNAERIDVEVGGASWLTIGGNIKIAEFVLSGAAKLNANNLNLNTLKITSLGSGRAELNGHANFADIHASDASKVFAFTMTIEQAELEASGISTVEVDIRDQLRAESSDNAEVKYKGSPTTDLSQLNSSSIEPVMLRETDERDRVKILIDEEDADKYKQTQ